MQKTPTYARMVGPEASWMAAGPVLLPTMRATALCLTCMGSHWKGFFMRFHFTDGVGGASAKEANVAATSNCSLRCRICSDCDSSALSR